MFETLAPYIIAGLLFATGYMFTRWLSNLEELGRWKDLANGLDTTIVAMREEGCRAMGALENIFNGVTAGGMPHSNLVKKVADVASDVLLLCVPCEHKEEVDELREAVVATEAEVERLAGELMVARTNLENWQIVAANASGRADEAERLLGLANDRLVVKESEECE